VADRPWKAEERRAAALLGGQRYPANTDGRMDVEGPTVIAQVKHRRALSLAVLEALAVEAAEVGRARGKVGLVVVKRRAGAGRPTPRLVVMTEPVCRNLLAVHRGSAPPPDRDRRPDPNGGGCTDIEMCPGGRGRPTASPSVAAAEASRTQRALLSMSSTFAAQAPSPA